MKASAIFPPFSLQRWQMILFLLITVLSGPGTTPAQQALVPASQQIRRDRQGNEWNVEQNGTISRSGGGGNSILSGAAMLMVGNDQFYCNQPMATADGKELVLQGSQPMMGALQVTRQVRFLEKEGGLRYLEIFLNPTNRDIAATVELRQNFSRQVKRFLADSGRTSSGTLEKGETGIAIIPDVASGTGWFFTYGTAQSQVKPRISANNQQYQMSAFFSITVPAGKTVCLMHTIAQARLPVQPDKGDLEKVFKPVALARHLRELPKSMGALVVNLRGAGSGALELSVWFPDELMGIKREAVDVLAMGEATRLRGRATCAKLVLHHPLGEAIIPWEQVAAIAGGRHDGGTRIHLVDGQIFRGRLEAEELKFTLGNGLKMDLKIGELDRLVLSQPAAAGNWPEGVAALLETWNGERWVVRDSSGARLLLSGVWGQRDTPLSALQGITSSMEEGAGSMVSFRDGSRLRVWLGTDGGVEFQSPLFSTKQRVPGLQIKGLIVASAENAEAHIQNAEEDPTAAFVELPADQRLVAPLADATLHVITSGGAVPLDPAGIKEMRNVTDDIEQLTTDDAPWFQIELWGGGSVLGQLRESSVTFRIPGGEWAIPSSEVLRIANPVPKIADATLTKVGQLIRELGSDDWRTREKATGELRLLGELARSSMEEALRQAEDPEVKRRLESVLNEAE